MNLIVAVIAGIYVIWILWLWTYLQKTPWFETQKTNPVSKFSIIIPFKNEAENLPRLLDSLQQLDYPESHFEIIMIDDHSVDDSLKIVENHNDIKLLKNQGSGKKQALQTGITQAQNEWIISIDADCEVSPNYLQTLNAFILQKQPEMILGPVRYFDSKHFLGQFQQFEFLCLQALTMASAAYQKPFLANGANLIFRKQSFEAVGGYDGNMNMASGDDVFLLQKFVHKFPDKIHFIKSLSATVKTQAAQSLTELIQQKIRWAGKSKTKGLAVAKLTGILMVLFHMGLIYALITFPVNYGFVVVKFLADSLCLYQVNRFYRAKLIWWFYPLAFMVYPFYLIVVFVLALKGTYRWKGDIYKQ